MTMFAAFAQQMPMSWHNGGLFMGMHWLWWGFWIVLLAALASAFWRLKADRSATHRRIAKEEFAESALRERFAKGEIDEQEYARKLKILRESILGR